MTFLDIIVLWLIVGFITVVFLSIRDYVKYRMLSTIPDMVWYAFLFLGGPVYCIVRITKRLHKRKYKFDSNWKKARTYTERGKNEKTSC